MLFKKENMSKKKISASDLATSIYKSLCNGFGVQPSKEDEQEVKSVFGTLFGDTPVEVNSYVDDDGSTVTVASVNMCNKSEDKCQCTTSEDKCQCTTPECKCKCTDSSSETQYSTPAIAASKDLVERMYGISHCTKAQTIDELPKEKNKMSLRDRIFADHRVDLQRVEDEKRQAYEQYLVDLITEKLENDEFEYLAETYNGTSAGVLVEIDEYPTSAIVINVARVLKADQEWSRIEYMQQNNKTFLKFYF
jgi:hypothetical protein